MQSVTKTGRINSKLKPIKKEFSLYNVMGNKSRLDYTAVLSTYTPKKN